MSVNSDRLQLYLAAEANILEGQEVRMGERYLRRADLPEVRKTIAQLQAAVAAENRAAASGGRATFGSALSDFSGGSWRGDASGDRCR